MQSSLKSRFLSFLFYSILDLSLSLFIIHCHSLHFQLIVGFSLNGCPALCFDDYTGTSQEDPSDLYSV